MTQVDFTRDFLSFYKFMFVVEGAFGPQPVIPPFLEAWLQLAFPLPDGNPAARNIADFRTKKEGKSALAAAVAAYMASRKPYQEVVIVASDKDQAADRVLKACKYGIERGPMAPHARVYKDVIEIDNSSIIQAMPNDWRGAAGGNYSCIIFDELHSWIYENNRRVFDEMIIPPTQPNGVRWIASYAGWEGESLLLREWWDRALAGDKVNDELPFYANREASLLAFVDAGPESWRMPWMNERYIREVQASERPNTFRRIWLNEWVSGEGQFLPEGAWDACFSMDVHPLRPKDTRRVVVGVDASTSRDLTALIGATYNRESDTVDITHVRAWKPTRGFLRLGKPTIDLAETVGTEVTRLHKGGQLDSVIADPFQLHALIIEWEKAGIKVIELPQTSGRVEADQGLYDAVIGRTIRHYNEPILNEHIRNAVALETPRGFRLAKEKTNLKIDCAVALSMAHWGAIRTKGYGEVSWIADPFADWPPPEGYIFDTRRGWHMPNKYKRHSTGATSWRDCRYRNKGCDECEAELKQEGYYREQEEASNVTPMGEQEFYEWHDNLYPHLRADEIRRKEYEHKISSKFWSAVNRRRMAQDGESPEGGA